jgi:hypothetical protein
MIQLIPLLNRNSSQILLESLAEKANCLSVYANEQSDRLLARPLSDKALPHVTFNPPVQ